MQRSMWVEACLEKEFKDKCVPIKVYACVRVHTFLHMCFCGNVC